MARLMEFLGMAACLMAGCGLVYAVRALVDLARGC